MFSLEEKKELRLYKNTHSELEFEELMSLRAEKASKDFARENLRKLTSKVVVPTMPVRGKKIPEAVAKKKRFETSSEEGLLFISFSSLIPYKIFMITY